MQRNIRSRGRGELGYNNHNMQSSRIQSRVELGYNNLNMQNNVRDDVYILDSLDLGYNHNMQNNVRERVYVFNSVDLDGGVSRVMESTTQDLEEVTVEAESTTTQDSRSFQNLEEVTIEAESSSITDCSICLGEIGSSAIGLPCSHVFHRDCITKWLMLRNSCPLCRCSVSRND
ncbi:uncharacterized protein LOC133284879 [Gastrolobium bilobum]|uniref:uncharacterized protein LOC133284879 n=1 Tax=Gastrolobium bilobum TaxID=150636 RepID=UPI002AB0ACCF|nr:uncharacterized protein LOC133284879 [Gastrolobium bilobum]